MFGLRSAPPSRRQRLQEQVHDWSRSVPNSLRQTADRIGDEVGSGLRHTRDATSRMVRERPVTSLLAAVAVGAVVGGLLLWRR